ncbi:hypothetical protein SAMN05443549_11425 [Flavobacterium fluvii]|uniref:Uncharacterized protein n=1 Tax=Flavobacterium fluvii TaxID=468056 RepID=A0A1M5PWQ9_9FLAO|nr:hypothetical protein [Flavobacterium fluvii]SHH06457.1 hypothetical protein SAMN05443549_11425 [Flavobacterium fluvii]
MKNIFIQIIIIYVLSFNTFAQKEKMSRIGKNMKTNQKESDTLIDAKSNLNRAIKSYHVEENINLRFGGYTMTYEVSHLSLIDTYDLGPNNTRVITPRYGELKQLSNNPIEPNKILLKPTTLYNKPLTKSKIEPINTSFVIPHFKEKEHPKQYILKNTIKELLKTYDYDNEVIESPNTSDKSIYVYLIKTYERVAEKGYKSIEIFQKLGDAYFFDGNYTKAVKWYEELFKMTTTLGSEYYDRYAYSLTAIGEKDKAFEIIEKRDQLSGIEKK